ncbi:low molecular weight phosphatase family protein [Williamsia sp. MIQD14]|uniref:arsenate-mycothiol transferase ArsC n=1 Tax=Williamsia sp. MIQD14 TaxID=3425703 RepID=UPI003DA155BF
MSQDPPSVLFVCVKNAGKSQMAAALLRSLVGDRIEVHSAGTHPGTEVNALSNRVLAEWDIDISGETPRAVDPRLLSRVDHVITLGREAHIDPAHRAGVENWDTDEPSTRGIEGLERMRLVRDDIAARVQAFVDSHHPQV